jgi:hypothetical protein
MIGIETSVERFPPVGIGQRLVDYPSRHPIVS